MFYTHHRKKHAGSSGLDWQFVGTWADLVMAQATEDSLSREMHDFFLNVLESFVSLVSGNPEEEQTLAHAPNVLSALVKLMHYHEVAVSPPARALTLGPQV